MESKVVLILGEAPLLRKQIEHLLKSQDINSVQASLSTEALEILKNQKNIFLILAETPSVQAEGFVLAEKLQEFIPNSKMTPVPIIMLSTESSLEMVKKAKNLGVAGWLKIPVKKDELSKILERFLRQ